MLRKKRVLGAIGLLAVTVLLSGCLGLGSEVAAVIGTVQYEDGTPIAGATVTVRGIGALTDDDGRFELK